MFLTEKLLPYDKLYILGDFFNLWIGDDHNAKYIEILEKKFLNLKHKNIRIFIMRGNRDFLIGEKLAKRFSATLLPDPFKINIKNKSILLTHGDLLCTNDKIYIKYRNFVQSKLIKSIFLSLPYFVRNNIANFIRNKSKKRNADIIKNNDKSIADVNITDVEKLIEKFNATLLIHGHTHKELTQELLLPKTKIKAKRIVLGEWLPNKSSILQITDDAKVNFLN